MPDARHGALAAITAIVLFGTIYSVVYNTYLDTSNPLLTSLPHPLHKNHYFASKQNLLNIYFIKRVWGWTTAAWLAHYLTSPPTARTKERLFQYLAATAVWLTFTSWFFGPALLERVIALSGGECVLALPDGGVLPVPQQLCDTKTTVTPATHPGLFAASIALPDAGWKGRPRLRRGHDVSGHIFLLTMSVLFLVDQLRYSFSTPASGRRIVSWSPRHQWAVVFAALVVALELFAAYTTSVYFHTPLEKLTGFVLGLAGFAVTQLPLFQTSPEAGVNIVHADGVTTTNSGHLKGQ